METAIETRPLRVAELPPERRAPRTALRKPQPRFRGDPESGFHFNPRSAICRPQSAVCSLRPSALNPRPRAQDP
eukprot:2521418-Alexandrium_andersonii.AAC.1